MEDKVLYPVIKDKETGKPLLVRVSYNGIASCAPMYMENDDLYEKFRTFDTLIFLAIEHYHNDEYRQAAYKSMIKVRDFNGYSKAFNNLLDREIMKLRFIKNLKRKEIV